VLPRNILIIRQDRIGDCVLATCLPRELKARWPACRVSVLVRSATTAVFENNPHVDEILTDDWDDPARCESFPTMVGRLRRRRFTHALMLLPQARYNYMTFCAGIPVRVGHGIILFHALTGVLPVMTRKFRKGRHEAAYALDLARAIGVRSRNHTPEIHLTPQERQLVAERRTAWRAAGSKEGRCGGGETARLVGVHTTSGGSAPNWSPGAWAILAEALAGRPGIRVVLTDPMVPPELAKMPGVMRFPPHTDLRADLVNFAALDLLVSASTGPMHIAAALGVPTVSLFCPLPNCSPQLWGPLGNRAAHLLPRPEYCRDHCPGAPHVCDYSSPGGLDPRAVAAGILAGP
jgi:heptosyltransferase-2